ncbi:hypothetical protein STENM327S_09492 [Streptomyces tendae]
MIRSSESTRPETACTSTSSGARSPSFTRTRSARVVPSSALADAADVSTWSTLTPDQAARTRAFHSASPRAESGSIARCASAAGA